MAWQKAKPRWNSRDREGVIGTIIAWETLVHWKILALLLLFSLLSVPWFGWAFSRSFPCRWREWGDCISHFIICVTWLIQPYIQTSWNWPILLRFKIDYIHLLPSVLQITTCWFIEVLHIENRLCTAKEKSYLKEIICLLCELKWGNRCLWSSLKHDYLKRKKITFVFHFYARWRKDKTFFFSPLNS